MAIITKEEFLNTLEAINDKALQYALNDVVEDGNEDDLLDVQTDYFFDDFDEWFHSISVDSNWVVELVVEDKECRDRLIELTSGYDLVDIFDEALSEQEKELFA